MLQLSTMNLRTVFPAQLNPRFKELKAWHGGCIKTVWIFIGFHQRKIVISWGFSWEKYGAYGDFMGYNQTELYRIVISWDLIEQIVWKN